jgi:hypothetical protein
MTEHIIKETSGLLVETSKLGESGFILFSILVVAIMFLFAIYVAYRSQKTLVTSLMSNHYDNEKRIDDAHERIHNLETRENKCLEKLSKVTGDLQECVEDFKRRVNE